jgi:hypothetical protein
MDIGLQGVHVIVTGHILRYPMHMALLIRQYSSRGKRRHRARDCEIVLW